MDAERTSYTERTPWPGFATAIFWAAIVLSCYPILAGWDTDLPFSVRVSIVGAIVGVAIVLKAVVGGLTVRAQETRLWIHLGKVSVFKKVVPYADIAELESVEYQPIREFGGWGMRGFGKRRAWTARGNHAVKLTFVDGSELLIGSDHPQRLEERIRALAGDQLGRAGA